MLNTIKQILLICLLITVIGWVGRMDMQDEINTAQYDKQNKQEVIKDWQLRCATGDIFDKQICDSFNK